MFASHYRLTLSGIIGDPATAPERFTFGLCLAKAAAPDQPGGSGTADGVAQLNQEGFDDIVSDSVAFFSRSQSLISDHARLTEVKWAIIGPDGKYLDDPMIAGVSVNGTVDQGEVVMPPQVALAVSLNTERRGPTGKGRFYIPAPGARVLPTTLLLAQNDVDAVRDSVAMWCNDLNNQVGVDDVGLGVCVASTKGYNTPVTSVRVGRALDTIRSRRRSLAESYGVPAPLDPNTVIGG